MRHGKGSLFSSNGDVYKGDWKEDLRIGRGSYSRSNGFRYNGGWVDGMAQGYVHSWFIYKFDV